MIHKFVPRPRLLWGIVPLRYAPAPHQAPGFVGRAYKVIDSCTVYVASSLVPRLFINELPGWHKMNILVQGGSLRSLI